MSKKGLGFRLDAYNGESIYFDIYFEGGELKEVLDIWLYDRKIGRLDCKVLNGIRVMDLPNMRDEFIGWTKVLCNRYLDSGRIADRIKGSVLRGLRG